MMVMTGARGIPTKTFPWLEQRNYPVLPDTATVWVDALQFERGEQATAFQP